MQPIEHILSVVYEAHNLPHAPAHAVHSVISIWPCCSVVYQLSIHVTLRNLRYIKSVVVVVVVVVVKFM